MGFINELIKTVREDHDRTQENCAVAADISIAALSRYELGEREVSAKYYRTLFRLTGDPRLLHYLHPALQFTPSAPPACPVPPPGDPAKSQAELLDAVESLTQVARYNLRILQDGRVDESDDTMILRQQQAADQVVAILNRNLRDISAWRELSDRRGNNDTGRAR